MMFHDGHVQKYYFGQVPDSYTTWGSTPWFNSKK